MNHCHHVIYINSVQFSHSVMSDSLRPQKSQQARTLCPSPTPRVHPNSCPLSPWCHPAICWRSKCICFRMDWLELLAVQGISRVFSTTTLQKHQFFWLSAFFNCMDVQLSHPYMTTWKTIALTRWTFVGKVTSLLFNMLSRLVITFLPRSKHLLISWLQSPSAVILDPNKTLAD